MKIPIAEIGKGQERDILKSSGSVYMMMLEEFALLLNQNRALMIEEINLL
jgi:hypothetical protein